MTPDEVKLQGTWRIISAESNGSPVPPAEYDQVKIEILGDIGTETEGDQSMSVQFQLDALASPKGIDSTYLDGPHQGVTLLGIYELDEDHFRMCRTSAPNAPRPSTFATSAGSGLILVAWQRV